MQFNSNRQSLVDHLDTYIRSVSGVRKIFAASANNRGRTVAPIDLLIVRLFVHAFTASYSRRRSLTIALATDSRPTGGVLAVAVAQALRMNDCALRYLGIIPTPQLLAYCARHTDVDGGICITASHNPIGYNGLKFVTAAGAVIGDEHFARLSARFDALLADEQLLRRHRAAVVEMTAARRTAGSGSQLLLDTDAIKESRRDYAAIVRAALSGPIDAIASGSPLVATESTTRTPAPAATESATATESTTRTAAPAVPHCLVVADYNGGARACSVDDELCREYGAEFAAYGTRVGRIVRQIEPEGAALRYLQQRVARLARRKRRLRKDDGRLSVGQYSYIGYMTDNDGDRGNIVYHDSEQQRVHIVAPQELFALLAMIRLSSYRSNDVASGEMRGRHGGSDTGEAGTTADAMPLIVANGPTSHRVDELAARYGGAVRRAEVGEANVIGAAAAAVTAYDSDGLRCIVLLAGEGSNGGCIVAPAQVRDPLVTVLLILQALRHRNNATATTGTAADRAPSPAMVGGDGTGGIADLLRQLPQYRTTAVTDPAASLPLASLVPATARLHYLLAVLAELAELRQHGSGQRRASGGRQPQRAAGSTDSQLLRRSADSNAGMLPAAAARFAIHHYLGSEEHCYVEHSLATYTDTAHAHTAARLREDPVVNAALERGGGLKCSFFDDQGSFVASLWWRASATERKVRLIADVPPPHTAHYTRLLKWHSRLVSEACL